MKAIASAAIALVAGIMLLAAPSFAKQKATGQESGSGAGGAASMSSMNPNDVRQVQQALNSKGYNSGPVDGKFGPKTSSALKNFQQAQGMNATGKINQKTLAALGVSPSGAAAGGGAGAQSSGTGSSGGSSSGGQQSGGNQQGGQ